MHAILRKHIITIIILILVGAASLTLIVLLFSSMNTKISRVLETKERLSSYQKNTKAYREESEQFALLEKRLGALEGQIINDQTVPATLSFLEDLAEKDGTDFEITSVQTPVQNEKKVLILDFTITGSYTAVRLFLDQIQHQVYQIKFSKLEMFSEGQAAQVPAVAPIVVPGKPPVVSPVTVPKERQWRAVATIEVLNF